MHELGHVLGHDHADHGLMATHLASGSRWSVGDLSSGSPWLPVDDPSRPAAFAATGGTTPHPTVTDVAVPSSQLVRRAVASGSVPGWQDPPRDGQPRPVEPPQTWSRETLTPTLTHDSPLGWVWKATALISSSEVAAPTAPLPGLWVVLVLWLAVLRLARRRPEIPAVI
jgi:hypothetical protein